MPSSYTESHPVSRTYRCKEHGTAMSGDNIPEETVVMWCKFHAECETTVEADKTIEAQREPES